MNKKKLLIFFLLGLFLLTPVRSVDAHMLRTSGTIGAVIHIDPDDDPYVGVPSSISFELKDTSGKFAPALCNCIVTIEQEGVVLSSFPLFHAGETDDQSHAVTTYRFEKKGIYTVKLDGVPLQADTFAPFSVHYDVRVAREIKPEIVRSGSSWKELLLSSNALLYLFGGIGILALLVYLFQQRKKLSL